MAQKKPARKPRRKKVEAASKGLTPADVGSERPADGEKLAALIKDDERCIRCGLCAVRCPTGAMTMERFNITEQWAHEEQAL